MLTEKRLKELLDYNPESGVFTWKSTRNNKTKNGSTAGFKHNRGYRAICIDRRLYLEHRLVWLYMIGRWPIEQTDHINRDKTDNRYCNLREVTDKENKANQEPYRRGRRKRSDSDLRF